MAVRNKIVFIGSAGVGKTQLRQRVQGNEFNEAYEATIGATFANVDAAACQIWDTGGQERYHAMLPMYLKGAMQVVVCLDATSDPDQMLEDYKHYKSTIQESNPNAAIIVVLTKSDLIRPNVDNLKLANNLNIFQGDSSLTENEKPSGVILTSAKHNTMQVMHRNGVALGEFEVLPLRGEEIEQNLLEEISKNTAKSESTHEVQPMRRVQRDLTPYLTNGRYPANDKGLQPEKRTLTKADVYTVLTPPRSLDAAYQAMQTIKDLGNDIAKPNHKRYQEKNGFRFGLFKAKRNTYLTRTQLNHLKILKTVYKELQSTIVKTEGAQEKYQGKLQGLSQEATFLNVHRDFRKFDKGDAAGETASQKAVNRSVNSWKAIR